MSERDYGIVREVDDDIAIVEMPRTGACASCGLCACGKDTSVMYLTAYAPADIQPGERVEVRIDRGMRSRAQLWLLAVPLGAFLGAALVARVVFAAADGATLIISICAMGAAYAFAWWRDKRHGWSTRPVARIISHSEPPPDETYV